MTLTSTQYMGPESWPSLSPPGSLSPDSAPGASSGSPKHQASEPPVDMVSHPPHYKQNGMEVIEVLESFGLMNDAYLANVTKYVLRHRNKGRDEDLWKAAWYLLRRLGVDTQIVEELKKKAGYGVTG